MLALTGCCRKDGGGDLVGCGCGWIEAGVAQLVEHLPSKQDVASSNLVARSRLQGFWLVAE